MGACHRCGYLGDSDASLNTKVQINSDDGTYVRLLLQTSDWRLAARHFAHFDVPILKSPEKPLSASIEPGVTGTGGDAGPSSGAPGTHMRPPRNLRPLSEVPDAERRKDCAARSAVSETQSSGGSEAEHPVLGCLFGLVIMAIVLFAIDAWTGTWWGVIALPVAAGIVVAGVALAPPKMRATVGCLLVILLVYVLTQFLPAWKKNYSAYDSGASATQVQSCVERVMHDRNISDDDAAIFCGLVDYVQKDMADNFIGNAPQG